MNAVGGRPAYAVRGELVRDSEMVTGWCWSPDRAGERLRVSLLIDGQANGGTVAARLRGDLVRDGVCDGYHGFSLPLPDPLPPCAVIEAREWGTGQVFGRLVGPDRADIAHWAARTRALAADLGALRRRLDAPDPAARLRLGFAAAGLATGGQPVRPQTPAGLRLPWFAQPAVSLLFHSAAGWQGPLATCVTGLAALLRPYAAELIVADGGGDDLSAALASVPGLVLVRGHGMDAAAALNAAAAQARAPLLAIMRADACTSAAAAVLAQTARLDVVLVGGGGMGLAAERRLMTPAGDAPALPGLTLAAPRALFLAAGGLDPTVAASAELAALDFALRVRREGGAVAGCRPALAQPGVAGRDGGRLARNFALRWGRGVPVC